MRNGNRRSAAVMVGAILMMLAAAITAPAQNFSVLYNFKGGADGAAPDAGVIADSAGNLYGTTVVGGAYGQGTVFEVSATGVETVLYSFTGGVDGGNPYGSLIRDTQGNLYGTTFFGGSTGSLCSYGINGCGVLFEVNPTGKERVLYAFTGGTDGSNPYGTLIRDNTGNFYGTTFSGGDIVGCTGTAAPGCGVVFELQRSGVEMVLHSFTGDPDGENPRTGLARDALGNLYGTTQLGGVCCGTAFEINSSGSETVLIPSQGVPTEMNLMLGLWF